MLALILTGVLIAGGIVAWRITASSSPSANVRLVVEDGSASAGPTPAHFCLDVADLRCLSGVVWRGWGAHTATGRGVVHLRACHPNCESGPTINAPATVRVSDLKGCSGIQTYTAVQVAVVRSLGHGSSESTPVPQLGTPHSGCPSFPHGSQLNRLRQFTRHIKAEADTKAEAEDEAKAWEVYKIPSSSMEPTLKIGQRVFVRRPTEGAPLAVGDIAILHPPSGATGVQPRCASVAQPPHVVTYGKAACDKPVPRAAGILFVKRIVAGPGDWLYIKGGHVYLSTQGRGGPFTRERDPYIRECGAVPECNFLTPIEIPEGDWFMMGDNRGASDDSRFWGPVPTGWIVGVVFAH